MKFSLALLSLLFVMPSLTAKDAEMSLGDKIGAVAVTGVSYWLNKNGKDLWKKTILPNQVKALDSKSLVPTLGKEMATAALFNITVLGCKTLFSQRFNGATIDGTGKVSGAPEWFEKAWTTGLALALGHTAYEMAKTSLFPDIVSALKTRTQSLVRTLKTDKTDTSSQK